MKKTHLILWPLLALTVAAGPARAAGRPAPWPEDRFSAGVDGRFLTNLPLRRIDGIPCVSLQTVRRLFGGRVQWRGVSRRVSYHREGGVVHFDLDRSSAQVLGKTVSLEGPVQVWGSAAYVPVSFLTTPEFQSVAGARVEWSTDRKTLTVDPTPSVSSPRYFSYPDRSRVVVELGPRVEYRLLARRGNTLVVRFYNGQARDWEKISVDDGLLSSVEMAPQGRVTDFTVTLTTHAAAPEIRLDPMPRSLIVETRRRGEGEPIHDFPDVDGKGPPDRAGPLPAPIHAAPRTDIDPAYLTLSPLRTIVIDAGHGGKDVGAVGPHGTYEKDVNLQVARGLADLLNAEGRFRVVLTRNDDRFLTLQERSSIANKAKADLFISVHCNAGLNPASSGFEIYFLSEKATDDEAAAVARRENAVIELEGLGGKARGKVEELLWALARNEHINESSTVAAHIARQAGKRLGSQNRGVKQAGFYVLRGTSMPAVLVESAFITNSKEEGLLRSSRYQQRIIDAVYAGLLDYEKRKIQARLAQTGPEKGGG